MSFYIERRLGRLKAQCRTNKLEARKPFNPFAASPEKVLSFNKGDWGKVEEEVTESAPAAPADPLLAGGGVWTPHKPGDFIPEHQEGMEYLFEDAYGKLSVRPNPQPSKPCWEHRVGYIRVLGYRYKMPDDLRLYFFGGDWTAHKRGDTLPEGWDSARIERLVTCKRDGRTWIAPLPCRLSVWNNDESCENLVIGWRTKK